MFHGSGFSIKQE